MENQLQRSGKKGVEKILRTCVFAFSFIYLSINNLIAQGGGADLGNLKNNLKALKEEQEKIAHDEFMSYVYMSVGFAVVIAIAWFTTVSARKRSKKEAEERQRFHLRQQELKKHGHIPHKARR
jgi:hypothetical protein